MAAYCADAPIDLLLISSAQKAILIKSSLIPLMTTRTAGGVSLITLRGDAILTAALADFETKYDTKGCRKLKIPSAGVTVTPRNGIGEQLKLDE